MSFFRADRSLLRISVCDQQQQGFIILNATLLVYLMGIYYTDKSNHLVEKQN